MAASSEHRWLRARDPHALYLPAWPRGARSPEERRGDRRLAARQMERDGLLERGRPNQAGPLAGQSPNPQILPNDEIQTETVAMLQSMGPAVRQMARDYLYLDGRRLAIHELAAQAAMTEQMGMSRLRAARDHLRHLVNDGQFPEIRRAGQALGYWCNRTGTRCPKTRFDPHGVFGRRLGHHMARMGTLDPSHVGWLTPVIWMLPPDTDPPDVLVGRAVARAVIIMHGDPKTHVPDDLASLIHEWQQAKSLMPGLDLPAAIRSRTGIRLDLPSNCYLPSNRPNSQTVGLARREVRRPTPRTQPIQNISASREPAASDPTSHARPPTATPAAPPR